ncbi:hypothetical protein CBM2595_A80040 [Cupriavidus taiwanensis]|nr:hypothetical protein CBM2595_A80040 [Cupriavidus taiwanensis]
MNRQAFGECIQHVTGAHERQLALEGFV